MNQIIPPAWRTHLGDHAFVISKFQRFLILQQLCLINLDLKEKKVSYGEANVLHHIGSDFLKQHNVFS